MAKSRPFSTFYSDGTQGRSCSAHHAALRAFKKVIEGDCRRATVTNAADQSILHVEKRYSVVSVDIVKSKEFK